MTGDDVDFEPYGPSELADWRAAASGLPLADFECQHGRLGDCEECPT